MKFPAKGLYAITQTDEKPNKTIIKEVHAALNGGAAVIQYRDKKPDNALRLGKELLLLCQHYKVPLIINDDADLANEIGADGVHIGQDDGGIARARKILGSQAIIGLSCYDDIETAIQAQHNGASYVAFGRFFPSGSKPLAAPAHIRTLQQAQQKITIPIVAIGGILPENGEQLLLAGASVLAVIGGIFNHDPQQSAQNYLKLFDCKPTHV